MQPGHRRSRDGPRAVAGDGEQLRALRIGLERETASADVQSLVATLLAYGDFLAQTTVRHQCDIGFTHHVGVRVLVGRDDQGSIAVALTRLNGDILTKSTIIHLDRPTAVGTDIDTRCGTFLVGTVLDDITTQHLQHFLGRLGRQLVVRLTARETSHDRQCSQYCYDISCLHIALSLY